MRQACRFRVWRALLWPQPATLILTLCGSFGAKQIARTFNSPSQSKVERVQRSPCLHASPPPSIFDLTSVYPQNVIEGAVRLRKCVSITRAGARDDVFTVMAIKQPARRLQWRANAVLQGLLVLTAAAASAKAGLVPPPPTSVWFLSPRMFEVLHTGTVQATFRVENAPDRGMTVRLLVNDTEALRTTTTQPSVALSGLEPGICELTAQVMRVNEVRENEVVASTTTIFLISSAAAHPNQPDPQDAKDSEGSWTAAVAFGSDDWGRTADMIPIFPHEGELNRTQQEGWDPGSWGRATVETAADVERLLDIVEGLNVDGVTPVHQRLVLSPYWMVGGPDIPSMAATGCPTSEGCEYRERLLDKTPGAPAGWPYCRGDLRALYFSGFEARLWHPQYHGRSHFDVQAWLSYLRSDGVAQRYFRRGMVFCNDTSLDTNQHPRTLLSEHVREHPIPNVSDNNPAHVTAWLAEGVHSFVNFWGYRPLVASMPHHACLAAVGDALFDLDFLAFDNTHIDSPLLNTLRVGFEPCCIPLSVDKARHLIASTIEQGHPPPHTPHPTPHTPHPTPHTPLSTPHTPLSTPYFLHPTPCTNL
jgi:hypothetical protein